MDDLEFVFFALSMVCGLLLIAFISLKVLGLLTWPWIWVLAPLWVPFAAITLGVIIWIIYIGIKK